MAYSAFAPAPRRRASLQVLRRPEPRSEVRPSSSRIEDRLLPVRVAPPAITAIYPPGYRPPGSSVPRPSGVTRTALPPVVAQRAHAAPAPLAPAKLPATPEMELPPGIRRHVRPVKYGGKGPLVGRVYEVPAWQSWSQTRRLAFMREFAEDKARDPHIAQFAAGILRANGVDGRDLRKGWAILLRWVQENVTYVNEPNERLQSPQFSLQARIGDCDDLAILLLALGHSLRWPARWVLSGREKRSGRKVRWIEGSSEPATGVDWAHIYLAVGGPPFRPTWWTYAEPTLKVPLGWDVVAASGNALPEMAGGPANLAGAAPEGAGARVEMLRHHLQDVAKAAERGKPEVARYLLDEAKTYIGGTPGTAKPAGSLPVSDPLFNVREITKELCLLEDHLLHPAKRCPDCIRKHLLRCEALAEEAISLDAARKHGALLAPLPDAMRGMCRRWRHHAPPAELAQEVRAMRKRLAATGFDAMGAADAPTTMVAAPTTAVVSAAGVSRFNQAVGTLKGIAWLNLFAASVPTIFAAWFTQRFLASRARRR